MIDILWIDIIRLHYFAQGINCCIDMCIDFLECEISSNSSALTMFPSTSVNLSPPHTTAFVFFNINLCQDLLNPQSSNFEDIIDGWYHDLLLGGNHSTDSTGLDNYISAAYGLYPSTTWNTQSYWHNKHVATPLFKWLPNDYFFWWLCKDWQLIQIP